jgi:RNA-binding protein YlmH
LTEAEQRFARSVLSGKDYLFFGGFDDAERRVALFLPDYVTSEDIIFEPGIADICYINILLSRFDAENGVSVSNRDVLGSLMGLGIKRELIGDIAVSGTAASIAVKNKISSFIVSELKKIGRYSVEVYSSNRASVTVVRSYRKKALTVASPRLDGIISGVFDISREKAADNIRLGLVCLNGSPVQKSDQSVKSGDTVSLRGRGKARITVTNSFSRKGRIIICAEIYL